MFARDGQMIDISRIIDHPNYSARTADYDISLLQLAETLSFTKKIQPIALPDADAEIADGILCSTSGWGNKVFSEATRFKHCLKFRQYRFRRHKQSE